MKFLSNFSIKNKLILIVLFVSIPALTMGFSYIIVSDIIRVRDDLVNKTRLDAALLGEYCIVALAFDDRGGAKGYLEKFKEMPNILNGFIFNEEGELFASYHKNPADRMPTPAVPKAYDYYEFEGDSLYLSHPIIYENKNNGTIFLRVSTEKVNNSFQNRVLSLILVLLVLIVISYLLALQFQGVISDPILRLAKVTEKISNQTDYSVRVKKEGSDEIGVLYDGFNGMLSQIQKEQKRRDEAEAEQHRLLIQLEQKNKELEQVIYVTSHDLRSPLVNIQGFGQELCYSLTEIEKIVKELDLPVDAREKIIAILEKDIEESLRYIQASTTKMDSLLSGLLKLSRVDRMATTFNTIDMNRMMSDILNAFEFQLKETGMNVSVDKLPPCFGNEMQVNQVFSNLISNAVKYRHPERPGKIYVKGKEIQENIGKNGDVPQHQSFYSVSDNGIGIPQDHQGKIFEIFHRLNPEDTEGEGLGLAIVCKIVNRHHGKIWVESEAGKGSCFNILLPTSSPLAARANEGYA
jgi:signal transduction histidine kinase